MWILWHFFSFKNVILVYIPQTFAQIIHCTKIKLCLETTCRLFLLTMYFIPAWLLLDRGSEKDSFQGSALMSSGHDYYIVCNSTESTFLKNCKSFLLNLQKLGGKQCRKKGILLNTPTDEPLTTNNLSTKPPTTDHQSTDLFTHQPYLKDLAIERHSFNPILHGRTQCARGRFFCLLWEHQGSWESQIFRECLKLIKVFALKKNCSKNIVSRE